MNKHCPECRDEFRSDVETCPDCGVRLLPGPTPDSGPRDDERSIELVRTRDRLMLTRLAGLLDEAGIAYESDEGFVLSSIVGEVAQPVRVLVLESDARQAREILAALEGAELEAEGELEQGTDPPDSITPE